MSTPLRIGVLLVETVQLLDLSAVDLFNMISPEYLKSCSLPKPIIEQGRPVEISYIGLEGPGAARSLTANLSINLTASLTDEAVRPGNLDIVFIPGMDPEAVPDEKELGFVRAHNAAGTLVMSVCTGIVVVGYSGIARGKRATGPRALVPTLRRKFPDVAEFDDRVRVVVDGNLWCSGGITNGHDMVAEYLRRNYPDSLVQFVLAMADVPQRSLEYDSSVVGDNAFFLWQIVKALPGIVWRGITGSR